MPLTCGPKCNKKVLALLTLTLAATLLAVPSAHATPNRYAKCRFQSADHHRGWSRSDLRDEISCAVTKFPVPGGYGTVLYIAERESGLYPKAVSPTGCCKGIYQQAARYWSGRLASFRKAHPHYLVGPRIFNARTNILVSVWMMHVYGVCPAWC